MLVTAFLQARMGAKAIDLLKEDIGGVCVGVKAEKLSIVISLKHLANGKHLPKLRVVSTK